MAKKHIEITRSKFAEKFLYLNGRPFSLEDYPHMYEVYNSTAREIVMKYSRQTAKSTTIANLMVTDCAVHPYFKTLYVSPTVKQTKVFSNDRVAPILDSSPLLKRYYLNSKVIQNVFTKQFLNGSRLYLQYALLNADKLRGLSTDKIYFDECQDLREDVLPIILESSNRSLFKEVVYAGTPKTTKGTLANLWYGSTQNEYLIKCSACGHWNLLAEENIGLTGPICSKCGKGIETRGKDVKAEWVSTYSQIKPPAMEGYRVCALHFAGAPWVNWEADILLKRERTPSKGIFYNEVLGLEYDHGTSPISELEIQACCDNSRPLLFEPDKLAASYSSIMGIDYGPINSENSFTTISVVQKREGKYFVVYMKRFEGKEADYSYIHRIIPQLMETWNCSHLAADHGMGESANAEIRSRIGFERVIAFQHNNNLQERVKWNSKLPAYILNRNQNMLYLFNLIKKQKISFPSWEYFKTFAEDMLNIQQEVNEEKNTTQYVNIGPDDFFHATLYAITALELKDGEILLNEKN